MWNVQQFDGDYFREWRLDVTKIICPFVFEGRKSEQSAVRSRTKLQRGCVDGQQFRQYSGPASLVTEKHKKGKPIIYSPG